ncbi:MAG TPA: hypothetical protein VI818_02305 [Candidatus Thermoplasmatota archaeon]|nr:hypothetical protein [Candidatus Thermoplasmatota archaeon]
MRFPVGLAVVLTVMIASGWIVGLSLERENLPAWILWVLLGSMLIFAARRDSTATSFLLACGPGAGGVILATLMAYLFWDASLDLPYRLGAGGLFGLVAGGLAALAFALRKTTNPDG